ncbi:MAG: oligosaccharide flippase family protein [Myxococcaceae bacterium]|nr:oligosaccharide flippase family protein [Myxococcaceae bacterium]
MLGPSGVGVTAEVTQYIALLSTPVTVVAGAALSSRLAEAHARQDVAASRRSYSTALSAMLLLSVVGGLLSTLVVGRALGPELGHASWLYGMLGAVGLFGGIVVSVPGVVLTAHGELKSLLRINLCAAVLPALATMGCISLWGLTGQFLSLALAPLIMVFVTVPLAVRTLPDFPWSPIWALDRGYLWTAVRLGGVTLLAGLLQQAVLVLIRNLLDQQGGNALVGQFQAAWTVGATYFGVVLGGLGSFAFPRYAAAATQEELTREVSEAGRFVLRVAPPIVFVAIFLADIVIEFLYSGRFAPSTRLLSWQFVGDVSKALSWVFGGALLYRGKVRATVAAEVFYVTVFGAGALVCVPRWGLEGVGFAYVGAYIAFLLLVSWLLKRECGVSGRSPQLWQMLGLTLAAACLVVAGRSWPAARLLALLAAGIWWWRAGALGEALQRAGGILRRVSGSGDAHLRVASAASAEKVVVPPAPAKRDEGS